MAAGRGGGSSEIRNVEKVDGEREEEETERKERAVWRRRAIEREKTPPDGRQNCRRTAEAGMCGRGREGEEGVYKRTDVDRSAGGKEEIKCRV